MRPTVIAAKRKLYAPDLARRKTLCWRIFLEKPGQMAQKQAGGMVAS
jgi:hypothetical protein